MRPERQRQLQHYHTKQPVVVGDWIKTFSGERCKLLGWVEPQTPQSTGRIHVRFEDGHEAEYYPSVCNLEWFESDVPSARE